MKRLVHFQPPSGPAPECYRLEYAAWERAGEPIGRDAEPKQPRRTTNLDNVTCPNCWRLILERAGAELRKQKKPK